MPNLDIIRAWKDAEFRQTLSDEQRAQLPANPAGTIEIQDPDVWDAGGVEFAHTWCICRTTTR
jgi:mersacidin/lichenicidin family type 2 lantibiotic